MSLLHRWSFPSRGFLRDRYQDEESLEHFKFPIIRIGQPCSHQRAESTSTFLPLLDDPENYKEPRVVEDIGGEAGETPPLASRRRNILSDLGAQNPYRNDYRGGDIHKGTINRWSNGSKSISIKADLGTAKPLSFFTQEIFDQVELGLNVPPKIRHFSTSTIETCNRIDFDDPSTPQSAKPPHRCERMRSTSSSYPSEGIRSPITGHRSPEPVANHNNCHFVDYRCYGRYPSLDSWHLASTPVSEASGSVVRGKNDQTMLSHNGCPSKSTASSKASLLTDSAQRDKEATHLSGAHSQYSPKTIHKTERQHKSSSASEITIPILKNENPLSSRLEVSFIRYRRLLTQSLSEGNQDHDPEDDISRSMGCLRASSSTNDPVRADVRQSRFSDGESAWPVVQDIRERSSSRASSWLRLFTSKSMNSSSNSSSQRMPKLRFGGWAKRVCYRTKIRFELVRRSVPKVKRTNFVARRHKQRLMKRASKRKEDTTDTKRERDKKNNRGKKKKKRVYWSVGRALKTTRLRKMQHQKTVDPFFSACSDRGSQQSGLSDLGG